jgi:hypothetical protein
MAVHLTALSRKNISVFKGQGYFGRNIIKDKREFVGQFYRCKLTALSTFFVNGLLGFFAYGIYTPRDARVYCSH